MQTISKPITKRQLAVIAKSRFGNMIKAVVDTHKRIMVIDADLHADEEALLLQHGSKQEHLWGINLYPELHGDDFIEFDSMINVRPGQENMSRGVNSEVVRKQITEIVRELITQ